MLEKSKTTSTSKAYKKALPKPIKFQFDWKEYPVTTEGEAEFIAANAQMTVKEQIKAVNAAAKASARTTALTAALEAAGIVRPTAENDDQIRLRDIYKTLLTAKTKSGEKKYTEEQARQLASDMTEVEWDDEGDNDGE
jgi:hypothetical protein